MNKILNDPKEFVIEMLDGLLKADPAQLGHAGQDLHCIVRADAPVAGKVALATGGGSGHLPVFLGYVGKGMLDGCAVGEFATSMEVAGASLTVMRLDDELASLLDHPARTPFFIQV